MVPTIPLRNDRPPDGPSFQKDKGPTVHTTELPHHPGTDPSGRTEAPDDQPIHYSSADAVAEPADEDREQRVAAQRRERAEAKAAEVRALASLRSIKGMGLDNNDDTHHAMIICRFLRADRYPEAIFAHRVLSRQVARDMLRSGLSEPELVQLVTHLFNYIDGEYSFENGAWATTDELLTRHGVMPQMPDIEVL
jgi:hypothetical protein